MPIECNQFWRVLLLGLFGGFVAGTSFGVLIGQRWTEDTLWPLVQHYRNEFWIIRFGVPYEERLKT